MRIVIIFSSPTPATREYENIWQMCPQSREVDPGKLVIETDEWKIFVFDGLSEQYCKLEWDYEQLAREIKHIVHKHPKSSIGVFFHGSSDALNRLTKTSPETASIHFKGYGSNSGKFYSKCIKPFSNGATDNRFNDLWKKLMPYAVEQKHNYPISPEHKLSGIIRGLRFIIKDAEKDLSHLQELKNLDSAFEELIKNCLPSKFRQISSESSDLHNIPEIVGNVALNLEMARSNPLSADSLKIARECLVTLESVNAMLHQS